MQACTHVCLRRAERVAAARRLRARLPRGRDQRGELPAISAPHVHCVGVVEIRTREGACRRPTRVGAHSLTLPLPLSAGACICFTCHRFHCHSLGFALSFPGVCTLLAAPVLASSAQVLAAMLQAEWRGTSFGSAVSPMNAMRIQSATRSLAPLLRPCSASLAPPLLRPCSAP